MWISRRTIAAFAIAAILAVPVSAGATTPDEQRIKDLQAQIDDLERQAAEKRAVIATTQDQADSLKKEITVLKNQVGAIQAEIAATNAKIDKTKLEIGTVQDTIGRTRATMSRKRETVARMVLFLDQRDHENLVAALFKYANLSQFLQQLHDLAGVQSKLLDIITGLKEVKAALETDQHDLESKQSDLERLNVEASQRKASLDGAKYQKDKLLKDTKGQEALYQKQLVDIEKQKAAFFKELRELELKVISGGLYIVHIKADHVPPRGTKLFQWPEDGRHITQGYGMTKYARRGAYGGAPHNGLDVSTGYGSPIKAIGDGTIVANGTNSGWGNWVAIQHPNNMVSLYAHMSSLSSLKVGTQVSTGSIIGYEGNTGNATGSHLHLSIYKEFFTYVKDSDGQLYFNYFEGSVNPLDYL